MKPTKAQLEIINSRLPGTALTADMAEILPFMVFDDLETDRATVMSPEMMRKLVADLNKGEAAFNKLHESRYNLPVGRSVQGRLVEVDGVKQVQALMYAVTKRPDGSPFEEGKDLADRYNTGAVQACSAGVRVGFYKCNICGNDIRDYNNCEHIPGRSYAKDEQPVRCIATMTGHQIVDGVAMDCGIYEVSAVTAGGVANAGSMTEAFGAYADGVDPKEFKKGAVDKGLDERIVFSAVKEETFKPPQEETFMSVKREEVEQMLKEHYQPIEAENKRLQGEFTRVEGELATAKTDLTAADEKYATLEGEHTTLKTEFTQVQTTLTETQGKVEGLEAFKAEYITIVSAKGVKAGKDLGQAEYEKMDLDQLKAAATEYDAIIDALPPGQQTQGEGDGGEEFAALPDSCYKLKS